jgi:enterochelin esterase-like enzyme
MNLIGDRLFYTLVGLAVGAVVLTLIGWNAVRGPRPLRWLTRLALIGVCQLSAVAVVGVRINDDNGLFASWSDLLGSHHAPSDADISAATRQPTVQFTDLGGGVLSTDYRGPSSGLQGQVLVWTPPQYYSDAYRNYRFPVIVLLHGVPGSPQAWVRGGRATTMLADLMRDGKMKPAVLVMPRVDPGGNTDCIDVPGGPQTATWLSRDVPGLIAEQFRVLDQPSGWAVVGDSTGGYCAAKLPLQYPTVFATGMAFSPDDFHGDPAVVSSAPLREANDPIRLASLGAPVSLLIATTGTDPSSTPDNAAALYNAARLPTYVAPPIVVRDGGHNWGTWQALYPAVFGWVGAHLGAPSPVVSPQQRAVAGRERGQVAVSDNHPSGVPPRDSSTGSAQVQPN